MPFELANGDLQEFRQLFRPANIWSSLREDHEAMRFWHVLREVPGEVWLQHGTGSVAKIALREDRIDKVDLLQGDRAEAVLREYGFLVSDDHRRRGRKFLRPGRPVDEAMEEGWPCGFGLARLSPCRTDEGIELFRYRLSWGGVLEVMVDGNRRVRSHRWYEGGDALDLLAGR